MAGKTDDFYLSKTDPNKSCLLALRHIILQQDEAMNETQKYGMPCFCAGSKALCYLWVDKLTREPYILIVNGNRMEHPALESGNRTRTKIFRVNPEDDIPLQTIETILQQALDLQRKK